MKGRVLVVDDDLALAEMLGIVLRGEGFEPSFVHDGDKALEAFRETRPDLVLLDLMLPGIDGIDVCRQIRAEAGVPIVMLTAKSDTVDVVLGLESGADDYIVKPFKPKELVARVRARLRRTDDPTPELLQIGDIAIDVAGHSVKRGDRHIPLTPLEFDLLVALARKPRQVFTREVLLEQVWGYRHAADTRLVNVHVQRLRAKIEKDPEHPEIVVTVRGVGYKAYRPSPAVRIPLKTSARRGLRVIRRLARAALGATHARWRRSIRVRVVTTTLVVSAIVVAVLGVFLMQQITNALLEAKERAALLQLDDGVGIAQGQLATGPSDPETLNNVVTTLARRSGTAGLYEVILIDDRDPGINGFSSNSIKPGSVPVRLRLQVERAPTSTPYRTYGRIELRRRHLGGRTDRRRQGQRLPDLLPVPADPGAAEPRGRAAHAVRRRRGPDAAARGDRLPGDPPGRHPRAPRRPVGRTPGRRAARRTHEGRRRGRPRAARDLVQRHGREPPGEDRPARGAVEGPAPVRLGRLPRAADTADDDPDRRRRAL